MSTEKICFRVKTEEKEKLKAIAESLNMNTSQYLKRVVTRIVDNPEQREIRNIYNMDLCNLVVKHIHTIDCMEDSELKIQLQKEMGEIICRL